MPKTKTPAPLTVPKATAQARRFVDKLMPGVGATVESRLSHDLDTDTPTVITTVTFPEYHHNRMGLRFGLETLPGVRTVILSSASIVINRAR